MASCAWTVARQFIFVGGHALAPSRKERAIGLCGTKVWFRFSFFSLLTKWRCIAASRSRERNPVPDQLFDVDSSSLIPISITSQRLWKLLASCGPSKLVNSFKITRNSFRQSETVDRCLVENLVYTARQIEKCWLESAARSRLFRACAIRFLSP